MDDRSTMDRARDLGGAPRPQRGWHPNLFGRDVPSEVGEWLAFAVVRDPAAESPLRALLASYELYAACEGHPAVSELALVRFLERLGIPRRGATFLGLRVHESIAPLRLLTRLEMYGFRFAEHAGELAWVASGPASDLERRVIARHGRAIASALREVEERRELLRGLRATLPPVSAARDPRRAA